MSVPMPGFGKNPDRDFSAGEPLQPDIDSRLLDQDAWGEALSYVDLLTNPTVQSRIAKMIVQSTIKRGRRGRRLHGH